MRKGYGVRPQRGTYTEWVCYDIDSGKTVLSGVSNQEAWAEVARRLHDAMRRGEDVSGWIWRLRTEP